MTTSKTVPYLAALCLCAGLAGCSGDRRDVTGPGDQTTPFASILSNPVRDDGSAVALGSAARLATAPATDVAYVSLSPGSIPDGIRIEIRNLATGFTRVEPIVNGGLDPVAVPASVGERLALTVTRRGGGTIRAEVEVPERRRPRVVRTVPTKGKRDVPLNTNLLVVFSEPLNATTITAASVQLVSGSTAVPVRLELTDPDRLVLRIVPEQPLEPSTTYTLVVSTAVQDLDGEALEQLVNVEFTTVIITTGSIRVTTMTSGAEPDPDGYQIGTYISGNVWRRIAPNATITFEDVPIGDYYLGLDGIIENCTLKGAPERAVTVRPGVTSTVLYEVGCVATTTLRIGTVTTGADADPDGYTAHVRRTGVERSMPVPTNGAASTAGLIFGDYTVGLSGVSANCAVSGPNPQSIAVPEGGTIEASFSILCAPATQIAYVGGDDWGESNLDIYVVKSNGTGATRLTTQPGADVDPDWSPDGRIAFRSDRDGNAEIYVMNADGSAPTRLTSHPAADYEPVWSPDGTRIAFVSERDGNPEIYVMNADGSGALRLTTDDGDDTSPTWSPDGDRIAFRSERYGLGNGEIAVMNADGSSVVRLTFDGADDSGPAWSPDGSKIAFARLIACDEYLDMTVLCQSDIFVMNPDGSGTEHIAGVRRPYQWDNYADDERDPAWSPDGRQIAIGARVCFSDGDCHLSGLITVVTLGASGHVDVIGTSHTRAISPAWRR